MADSRFIPQWLAQEKFHQDTLDNSAIGRVHKFTRVESTTAEYRFSMAEG